jgi:TPP-dependent pyruvate/acetoin dehydrogenase alpha subunit
MTKKKIDIAPAGEGFSLIPNSKLLGLYTAMAQSRAAFEAARARLPRQRILKGAESIFGHEAALAGAAIDLKPHDTVVSTLWPQPALKAINASVSAAPTIADAVRRAIAQKDNRRMTLVFSSSKAGAQASWCKAIATAAENNLPMLFVSLDRSPGSESSLNPQDIRVNRKGYFLPVIPVDGHDVVAVYRVATESMTYARKGHGPTVIDCRLAVLGDPLKSMESYLALKGLKPSGFD